MSETNTNNAFQNFARWFRSAIVRPITQNSGAVTEVFHNLGLNAEGQSIAVPAEVQQRIDAYCDSQTDESDIEAFLSMVADLKQVVDSVWSIAEALQNEDVKPEEIVSFTLQFFMFEDLRRNVPEVYTVLSIMEGVEKAGEHSGGGSGSVSLIAAVVNFFKGFGESHELATEAHAKRLSDVYFIGLPAILILLAKLAPSIFESILEGYLKAARFGLDLPPGVGSPIANEISKRALTIALSDKTTLPNGDKIGGSAYLSVLFASRLDEGPAFLMGIAGSGELKPKLSDTWSALMKFDTGKTYIRIGEGGGVSGNATDGTVTLGLNRNASTPAKRTIAGSPTGTRFELGTIEIKAKASAKDLDIKFGFKETALCIVPDNGFMRSFMEGQTKIAFELGIGYGIKKGFYIDGGSGFSVTLPMHLRLGPLTVQLVYLQLKATEDPKGFFVELSIAFTVILGPLTIAVDRMGLKLTGSEQANPPAGTNPWDFSVAPQPPRGLGIRVDASMVKGGGFIFFDPENGQYAGALELSIQNTIQIGAIGILTTKGIPNADGTTSDGFSLIIILSVSFSPGLAIGMGFMLTGLGGMLGLHRTINADKLLESVRNNAIDSILFPDNIVANASNIIRQVQGIFPPRKDQFIIGLMAKLSYGAAGLVDLQFGIALEFSNPVKLAILGVLKINVGSTERSVLRLQLNFIGILDFEKKWLAFDASLYDSRIIEVLTIEGDMCVRVSWGSDPGFVVSVGGFHPSFTPPAALNVPKMKRFTISILDPNPKIAITSYIAVTSNTFQFGAKIELKFKAGSFSIEGYLGFDVLFQFNPFRFVANIKAGIAVKMGGATLFSLELDFELSGPTPWRAKGSLTFKILFISIKIKFDVTWGDTAVGSPDIGIQVLPLVHESTQEDRNWTTELPPNRYDLISLRELNQENPAIVMQPFGTLRISQNILPLDFLINKFGNLKPVDIQKVDYSEVRIGGKAMAIEQVQDKFAPAVFNDIKDAEKLKSPSFENYKSGVKVKETDDITVNYAVNRPVSYEVIVSDFDPNPKPQLDLKSFDMNVFQAMTLGGMISKSELSELNVQKSFKNKKAVSVKEERYVIVKVGNLKPFDSEISSMNEAQAQNVLTGILASKPHLQEDLMIVPEYHLV